MIDIEIDVVDKVAKRVFSEFPKAYVTNEFVPKPPSFPCVMLREAGNTTLERTVSSASNENHATVMYDLDVFSVKKNGRKQEAKRIASLADEAMLSIGFRRVMFEPVDNVSDSSVFRFKGRYTAVVSKDNIVYGR